MLLEDAYAALFERVRGVFPSWHATRDMLDFSQASYWPAVVVNSAEMDAIQSDQQPVPAQWRLGATVILYLERRAGGEAFEPDIHAAIVQVVDALKAQPGEETFGQELHTTLGDVVNRAWVQGTISIHRLPGSDDRAIILIPLEMFVAPAY